MENYNVRIHKILSYTYLFRVLSYKQIYHYIFDIDNLNESYCVKTIRIARQNNLIEKIGHYKEESHYFITKCGIAYLRTYGVIPINSEVPITLFDFYTPAKVKIKEAYVKHQLSLNEFVFHFKNAFPSANFEYYDEIYVSNILKNIRPDGILKLNNTFYFLEMDMNTERKTRLKGKWENYRNFLTSSEYYNFPFQIEVLFILGGNIGGNSKRRYDLQQYIDEYLQDMIGDNFNAIIGTEKELLLYLQNTNIQPVCEAKDLIKEQGFNITKGRFHEPSLLEYSFDHYFFKPDQQQKVTIENGIPLEFLLDNYYNGNLYVFKKIKHFARFSSMFAKKKGRSIRYIILVESEHQALTLLTQADVFSDYILFTTSERLRKYSIYKALFRIDWQFHIYHFSDNNFGISIDEGLIRDSF